MRVVLGEQGLRNRTLGGRNGPPRAGGTPSVGELDALNGSREEAPDVGVEHCVPLAERKRSDGGSRVVADAGERPQEVDIGRHFAAVAFDDGNS